MLNIKKIGLGIAVAFFLVAVFVGFWVTQASYAFTLDVNPSIEIVSNRLDRVIAVNPKNEDARELLKDYKFLDKNLNKTIVDLADLMVLKGYISGARDNLVMITVSDNEVKQDKVDKLNNAIAAYLENKQIEATIINQSISEEYNKTGKELVAMKISDLDEGLDFEQLSNMTLSELVDLANTNNIAPEKLFSKILGTKIANEGKLEMNEVEEAETIVKYDLDSDDDDYNDKDRQRDNYKSEGKKQVIGEARAREIALGLVNGKIVEFEFDDDDDDPEYEIEIIANGYEYEIEIDAYTGRVLEFEKDDD
ncbi:MAG TPA: PepSY domain-containing protein [Tissierellaceae bacterium]|nr:PepSY domain-containing protein [Tissierellaceae bacterium]